MNLSRASRVLPSAILVLLVTPCFAANQAVTLDGNSNGRIFQGIGALSAGASSRLLVDYPEPYRSQILDYLFKPNYGASLQHLKVEIGADVNSTDGSEPASMRSRSDHDYDRGYEWWLMEEARKRNPSIILDTLPWGAPGWVGSGHFYSEDMAEYVADFLQGAWTHHHLDIAYTGIWNEKQFDTAYVEELATALKKHDLNTKIVCCDEYLGEGLGQWSVLSAMQSNPSLNKAVAVVGVHYPWVDGKVTTPPEARAVDKPLWSSEDQPNSGGGPILSRDWNAGGKIWAKRLNLNYLDGHFTKTEIWSPVTSYYDLLPAPNSGLMYANTPWSGHYDVQSAIWVTAHTTQFARPGWKYLDASSGHLAQGGSYVALKSNDGNNWSVILETVDAKVAQPVTFTLTGGLSTTSIHIWETNATRTFEHVADVSPSHSRFTYLFEPGSLYSLTTTTGQAKGTATPPPDKPIPLPYRDDFETTALNRAPKYLSDQDGAFEVHSCLFRSGRCLQQVITAKPIPWSHLSDPWTLAGDESWSDYDVAVDVLVSDTGPVTVLGRIDSANSFHEGIYPGGYVFRLHPDGAWQLLSTTESAAPTVLGHGQVEMSTLQWHHVDLAFHGSEVAVSLDGKILARVADTTHRHGMFGVGTGWNQGQFDNLAVVRN
ncbi:MAG: galactosylceramidase [Acidobacteriota bacterium]